MANASKIISTPRTINADDSITRPANSDAYVAKDVVTDGDGSYFEWDLAAIDGGSGLILSAVLTKSAQTTTDADFDLYLFDTLPSATLADGSISALTNAQLRSAVAIVSFTNGNAKVLPNAVQWRESGINAGFVCGAASTKVYGVLIARAGYVPGSGETFNLRLDAVQE